MTHKPDADRSSAGAAPATAAESTVLTRRRVFAGAGTAGALAVAATVLPLSKGAAPVVAAVPVAVADTGGYQLTDHVQRYYQTARV